MYQPEQGETVIAEPVSAELAALWEKSRELGEKAEQQGVSTLKRILMEQGGSLPDGVHDLRRLAASQPEWAALCRAASLHHAAEGLRRAFFDLCFAHYAEAVRFSGQGVRRDGAAWVLVGLSDSFDEQAYQARKARMPSSLRGLLEGLGAEPEQED